MNRLLELNNVGQSVWLDFLARSYIRQGNLKKLVMEDGVSGVTSNPTIFEKAILEESTYDEAIRRYLDEGRTAAQAFEAIAIEDVQQACDILRPVFERTKGNDGFVSIEVSPTVATNTVATLEEAARLYRGVNRPNAMVKIPATDAGIPAIQEAISNEININVTLIFSLERYQQVIGAWLGGLKQLGDRGGNIANVTSVASFFVSRVDTLVDKLLDEKIKQTNDDQKRTLESLKGKAAVANARQAYQIFEKLSLNPAFKALEAKGARLQRPLWASTSSKNPAYRDVMYVEKLIGPHTVNTMPLKTMEAFKDHGEIKPTISENPNESKQILDSLERAGIRMQVVGEELEKEGVRLFSDSYAKVVESIGRKRERIGAI